MGCGNRYRGISIRQRSSNQAVPEAVLPWRPRRAAMSTVVRSPESKTRARYFQSLVPTSVSRLRSKLSGIDNEAPRPPPFADDDLGGWPGGCIERLGDVVVRGRHGGIRPAWQFADSTTYPLRLGPRWRPIDLPTSGGLRHPAKLSSPKSFADRLMASCGWCHPGSPQTGNRG